MSLPESDIYQKTKATPKGCQWINYRLERIADNAAFPAGGPGETLRHHIGAGECRQLAIVSIVQKSTLAGYQSFFSMLRCCSSLRMIRFIQAEIEASPSCANACFIPASNSGSTRKASCLLPFPLMLMVDIWYAPDYFEVVTKSTASAYQKATPRSAGTHAGRLTTTNRDFE